ncbi:MAG: hypothetical protein DI635_06525 [Pseudoxanthomonas suwonensis]|nr:MAG: hypothetical protein DI635_06525 [Pseudoxanthomonas suwonensis]
MTTETYRIDINRTKIVLSVIVLFALAIGSIWMWMRGPSPDAVFPLHRSPTAHLITSICGVVFGIGFGALGLRRLMTSEPPLMLNPQALYMNIDGFRIPWTDIEAIESVEHDAGPGYVVRLKNPQKFLDEHADHRNARALKEANWTLGTPIVFYISGLNMDREKFERVATGYMARAANE